MGSAIAPPPILTADPEFLGFVPSGNQFQLVLAESCPAIDRASDPAGLGTDERGAGFVRV